MNCTVEGTALCNRYPHYKYSDRTAHMGVVYMPYQADHQTDNIAVSLAISVSMW